MFIATKLQHQARNNAAENLKLGVLGNELDFVTQARYLSVQVDNGIDWREQIKTLSSKVSKAIAFLKFAENILPIASVKTLYAGIVEPHFRYFCSVWGCCGATTMNLLQKLQNRTARTLMEIRFNALVDHILRASVGRLFVSS